MRKTTLKLYKFSELNAETQAKVLDKMRDINTDGDGWSDCVIELWQDRLAKRGYEDAKIAYSGFWSQGDGASFTATINLDTYLKAQKWGNRFRRILKLNDEIDAQVIRGDSHYSHENTIRASLSPNYYDGDAKLDEQLDELEELITEDARHLSTLIYKDLQEDYEASTSDEAVRETIEINEYEFEEDGSLR